METEQSQPTPNAATEQGESRPAGSPPETDTTRLFVEYLNVCNAAISKHESEFPYAQLIRMAKKKLGDKQMGVAVYEDDPHAPHDFFTVELAVGKLHFVQHGKRSPHVVWKVPRAYLKRVVDNRDEYIEKPAKLDFDWLKARLGVS